MNTRAITLRKRWLAMGAVAILAAVALAAGTLFAANERQRPELPATNQQPVESATGLATAVESPVDPPAPERVFTQANDDQQEVDLPPITKEPPKYPNLDSNLNRLVEQDHSQTQPAGQQSRMTNSIGDGSASSANPVLVTFYIEPEKVAAMRRFLENNDVFVRNVGEDYIEAHVPPALLPAASELPGVLRVDTVIPPEPQSLGDVVSQGVALHHADAWHRQGYRGQGVKVGVIDTGFEGFSQLQGNELPRNVTARCYFDVEVARAPSSRLADCEQAPCEEIACNHGTAVSETLVDVAPEVQLYIANPMSRGDLRDAADWMAEHGVQVVNMSLSWYIDGPGNGTSPYSNSPLKTIDAAVSSGIAWVNSGGNSARNVWYGIFSDPDGDGYHNFAPRDEGNSFFLPFDADSPSRSRVTAFMRWDDSWGGADCDLDLHLVRSVPGSNNDILIVSADVVENGDTDDTPFALVWARATNVSHEGRYYLAISKQVCPDPPAWVQLITWMADDLQHYSQGHHIGNPAESRKPGMLAVGATHWWDTEYIADYSSRGPTIDGRTKPDITGVACAHNATLGRFRPGSSCPFGGTSQASPHVAGLAALVKQRFPDYTPAQVTDYLKQNAVERGSSGADNLWGQGFATLTGSEGTVTQGGGFSPTSNIDVRLGTNTGEVVISWDAVEGATHYRIGYVNMEVDYNLAKASCTGEWIEAFVYIDVNARNIPVSNGRAEYTLRRVSPGARHAFTVLTSNSFVDSGSGGSVSSEFFWASPRWKFLPGRDTLPAGIALPSGECTP